jgi:cytosine/adenosine deaminase-related metal-dependent hydrolase
VITRVKARWVLPIAAPILPGGWVDVDATRGEIVAIGAAEAPAPAVDRTIDIGDAVVLPGLVNAHTHLELSHLAGRVPPADAFVPWVRSMLAARRASDVLWTTVTDAALAAIAAMAATGTAGIGDIGNTDAAIAPLASSSLYGVHFREALGFDPAEAARVASGARLDVMVARRRLDDLGCTRLRVSLAPHAPYSTSAPLIQALAPGPSPASLSASAMPAVGISSIHLGESPEEVEFLATGTGPIRALLQDLGKWDAGWQPPGTGPVEYLESLGALHRGLLVVHGTQLTPAALRTLARIGATLVLCARSNRWVGAGVPPVAAAVAAGVPLAIGTDSLASVEDLNLFAELAFLRTCAPSVPASVLLRAATLGGARALGCVTLGLLAPGASSRAVVRTPPAGVTDVEEWLVADAADTRDLRWLDALVRDHVG